MYRLRLIHTMLISLMAVSLLTACQDGDAPQAAAERQGKATVGVLFTDAPGSPFDEVNVTVTEVSLIADDEDGEDAEPVVLFNGEATVNLLALQDHATLFAIAEDVPARRYSKVRLTLKQPNGIELIRRDASGEAMETVYPEIGGNGKLDLNPRGGFNVVAGETLYVQLDMDPGKSLHIVRTGNGGVRFRPVVFVDIVGADNAIGKLVRFSGTAHDAAVGDLLVVCDDAEPQVCLEINTAEAQIFDADAQPAGSDGIVGGDPIRAVGFMTAPTGDGSQGAMRAVVIELNDGDVYVTREGQVSALDGLGEGLLEITHEAENIVVNLSGETALYNHRGQALSADDLTVGMEVHVDGVFSDSAPPLLQAVLLIAHAEIDEETGRAGQPAEEKLEGTLLTVDGPSRMLTLSGEDGDRLVQIKPKTRILLIGSEEGTPLSQAVALTDLPTGTRAEAYGHWRGNGVFQAQVVLVEAP